MQLALVQCAEGKTMNITSYNVTDVGYHYIGLRALDNLAPGTHRDKQTMTISQSVRKYVTDKALRMMLPEPRGTFETAGVKITQELTHLGLAASNKGSYELTEDGQRALLLLNTRQNKDLRRFMVRAHLKTYDNLRMVVKKHLILNAVWRPFVGAVSRMDRENIASLLIPTFGSEAYEQADELLTTHSGNNPKELEDALSRLVLRRTLPEMRIGVPMFRAMCDRLTSLRLLNQMRSHHNGHEFLKTYTPCVEDTPPNNWYVFLDVDLISGESFPIYLCEPDMAEESTIDVLLAALYDAFEMLTPTAGYFDLPEIRDTVSENLRIPEAAFDEGLNRVLDLSPCPLTVGLTYEGTTARRKPLVRDRGSTQIFNLIRKA